MDRKIKVRFPDGVREVPAYLHIEDSYYDFQGLGAMPEISYLKPEPVEGYRFLHVIGHEYHWVAYEESRNG